MDLSELIEEFREHELHETNPHDWMGYLEDDEAVEELSTIL